MPARPSQPSHGPHGGNQSVATPPIFSSRREGLSRRATQRSQHNRKRLGVNTLGNMNPRASRLNLNHPSGRRRFTRAFVTAHLTRLGNRYGDEQWRLRRRRFRSLRPCAFSPVMQQAAIDAIPTRHRRDIRAWLKALRQNPRPLLISPAQVARRPCDQLDPAIAIVSFATVLMSVIMTVILHGATRRIQGPLRMLSNAARLGRCDRRVIAVPLTADLALRRRRGLARRAVALAACERRPDFWKACGARFTDLARSRIY